MKVQAVTHKRAYRQIVEQILNLIEEGNLSAGDRLPSEREMAELFSTSRPTVREAMSALELAGVVKVRVGKGVFVVGSAPASNPDLSHLDEEAAPSDLMEAREILEPHTAALAATRADEQDIQAMTKALDGCREAAQAADTSAFERHDDAFHAAIGEAAKNPILTELVAQVSELRTGRLWKLMKRRSVVEPDDLHRYTAQHEAILAAIRDGDAQAAMSVATAHLTTVRSFLLGTQDAGPPKSEGPGRT